MKNLIGFIILAATISTGCRKEVAVTPPSSGASNYVRFQLEQLPGITDHSKQYAAIVTLLNEQDQEVVSNRKLPLQYNGRYSTDKILLPAGKYRVTSFLLRNAQDSVAFATPRQGSVRASQVSKPLSIAFNLPAAKDLELKMEVAAVSKTDRAEDFGYPAGAFGEIISQPVSGYYRIKVRGSIQIGTVLYDSIPALMQVSVWDKQNQLTITNKELQPGTNELLLPRLANKYALQFDRWGYHEQQFIDPALIDTLGTYEFKGVMDARKLSSEVTYRVIDGTDKAETKSSYFYNADNTLERVLHYEKKADGTPFLAYKDRYTHLDGQLQSVTQTDEQGNTSFATSFLRNGYGQPNAIVHTDKSGVTTNATVNYRTIPEGFDIQARYQYSHNSNTLDYNMRFVGGNMIESTAATSNLSTEIATYQYDFNINPHAVIHVEDLLFTHRSKNNRINQWVQYNGSRPEAVVYSFEYKYDNLGYPTQVIRKYRSPLNNQHLYTTKTVYSYYE